MVVRTICPRSQWARRSPAHGALSKLYNGPGFYHVAHPRALGGRKSGYSSAATEKVEDPSRYVHTPWKGPSLYEALLMTMPMQLGFGLPSTQRTTQRPLPRRVYCPRTPMKPSLLNTTIRLMQPGGRTLPTQAEAAWTMGAQYPLVVNRAGRISREK